MKFASALFAAALLAVTPAAAQPHPTSHASRPTTHAPVGHPTPSTARPRTSARRPTTHTVAHHRRPTTHTHHAVSHHRHPTVRTHHVAHAAPRPAFHRAPTAVVARLRKNVVAVHRFHAGAYRAPPGWRYRRWTFGERLPGLYFGRDFWITDFLAFGLFAPPDGLIWVRYGPDALLIDQYTGEIVQVDYGVFY